MRVIDRTVQKVVDTGLGKLGQKLSDLSSSFSQKGPDAQELMKNALRKTLDNSYALFCNIILEGLDLPIPLILLGPSGVKIIQPSDIKGIFRARENIWEVLDSRTQDYKAARPNLLAQTELMANVLYDYLTGQGISLQNVEPVLFFADPGVHIESSRAVARIVLTDALERFAASIAQGEVKYDFEALQKIFVALGGEEQPPQEADPVAEARDIFSFQDEAGKQKSALNKLQDKIPVGEPEFVKKLPLNFTRRQWIWLILLLVVAILMVGALILFVSSQYRITGY